MTYSNFINKKNCYVKQVSAWFVICIIVFIFGGCHFASYYYMVGNNPYNDTIENRRTLIKENEITNIQVSCIVFSGRINHVRLLIANLCIDTLLYNLNQYKAYDSFGMNNPLSVYVGDRKRNTTYIATIPPRDTILVVYLSTNRYKKNAIHPWLNVNLGRIEVAHRDYYITIDTVYFRDMIS